MSGLLLEVAANSLASALAAQDGGADRIELCENLGEGGCTPSYASIALARERLRIPLYVLIRARAGDFLYDALERELMRRDIENCARLGCDGVVIGALDADGEVDRAACAEWIAAAGGMGLTFHRALDAARDPARALEDAIALGCERVLTSGAAAGAPAGAPAIAALVRQGGGRIAVMAGAGIEPGNVAALVAATGVREVHASAKALQRSRMRYRNPALAGLEPDWIASDRERVVELRRALDACGA
ncbi:copper homeostasis protein CutC [Lysobacter silvisoli]|uniref:PF03932 family protein CutC n=1 Tax=Lysobacter silvisoli TaxID=2293254 RepID=A0A371JZB6_9GAMM|nr:copper homeostasis protein CutC [Lysobacter silvisoli]RDZ27011.1 copper homeostasis protein CutC [Lysobacter silvisoli]